MRTRLLIIALITSLLACDDNSGDPGALPETGKGGSLARFALSTTHLYAVDEQSLNVYRFADNGALINTSHCRLGADIETIYIQGTELYIGAQDGMRIFDITNPDTAAYKAMYPHITACDPVVVQDTLAFVTFRINSCRNVGLGAMEIVDIRDPEHPVQLSSYSLKSPYGLAIKNNLLFVCDNVDGLKIFDITNPYKPAVTKVYSDILAQDIIIDNDRIILTAPTGISQYSWTLLGDLQKLSEIPIVRTED